MFEELHRSRDRYLRRWLAPLPYRLTRLVTRAGALTEALRTGWRWRRGALTAAGARERLGACQRIARGWPVHAPERIGWLAAPATSDRSPLLPLTVVVLTLNEARHIRACLAAAGLLEPAALLVVDSGSQDATVAAATAAGARVVTRPFDGYANQRNAALELVTTEWVYFVDADERVTPAQAAEIRARLPVEGRAGYWVPRDNRICGRSVRGGGWWPDAQLRLFRLAAGRYDPARQVHELVVLDGPTGHLTAPLIHYNYESWRQVLAKQRHYTARAVRDALAAGRVVRPRNYLLQPARAFWRRYLTLGGYRDGWLGLGLALVLAYYEFQFYVGLGRARRQRQRGEPPAELVHSGVKQPDT
jgi:hypothetical protein